MNMGGDQNSKWMQYVTTMFFKITCVRAVVHYHLFCFSFVFRTHLFNLPRFTLRNSEETDHDNSVSNATIRVWTQTIAPSDGGSQGFTAFFPPLVGLATTTWNRFQNSNQQNQKMFHQNCFKRRNWNRFSKRGSRSYKVFSNEQAPTMACLQKRERETQNICSCEATFGGDISNMRVSEPTFATE